MAALQHENRRPMALAGAARVAYAIAAPCSVSVSGFGMWSSHTNVLGTTDHKPGSPRTTSVSTP